jgi:hypothetical protein
MIWLCGATVIDKLILTSPATRAGYRFYIIINVFYFISCVSIRFI